MRSLLSFQGPIVRKKINGNLGLRFTFFLFKRFSKGNFKIHGKTNKRAKHNLDKSPLINYLIGIKINAIPGLALSRIEQPVPGGYLIYFERKVMMYKL